MTMHCFRHAIRIIGIVFAIMPIAGCGGRGTVEKTSASRAAFVPADPASDTVLSGQADHGAASNATAAGGQRNVLPTPIEQHHFNAYKHFHAMLEASSGSSGDGQNRGDAVQRSATDTDSGCSASSLIKRGE